MGRDIRDRDPYPNAGRPQDDDRPIVGRISREVPGQLELPFPDDDEEA